MKVELLQPRSFGTGKFKPGDIVDVAHTLGEDMIKQGFAKAPSKKTEPKTAPEPGKKTEPKTAAKKRAAVKD